MQQIITKEYIYTFEEVKKKFGIEENILMVSYSIDNETDCLRIKVESKVIQ